MKNRFYAISLLVSLLVMLGHEIIPHHHNNAVAFEFSSHSIAAGNYYNSSPQTLEDEAHDISETHHKFPKHSHQFSVKDYELARLTQWQTFSHWVTFVAIIVATGEPATPSFRNDFYPGTSFRILPQVMPGANALRAPPIIA